MANPASPDVGLAASAHARAMPFTLRTFRRQALDARRAEKAVSAAFPTAGATRGWLVTETGALICRTCATRVPSPEVGIDTTNFVRFTTRLLIAIAYRPCKNRAASQVANQ